MCISTTDDTPASAVSTTVILQRSPVMKEFISPGAAVPLSINNERHAAVYDSDPLFEILNPVVGNPCDCGPRSAPPAEDFPIHSYARLAPVFVCRDIYGDSTPAWWAYLAAEGVELRVLRHAGEFSLVTAAVSVQAWGLVPSGPGDEVLFRVMVHRACLHQPRISRSQSHCYPLTSSPPQNEPCAEPTEALLRETLERGNRFLQEGHCEAAVDQYSTVIRIAEQQVVVTTAAATKYYHRALSNRSAALFRLHKFDEAYGDGQRCIAVDPTSVAGYIRAGTACRGKKEFNLADSLFHRALILSEKYAPQIHSYIEANATAYALNDIVSRFAKSIDVSIDPHRVMVIAKRRFKPRERIFIEVPLASVAIDPTPSDVPLCDHCHTPLWSQEAFSRIMSETVPSLSTEATTQAISLLGGSAVVKQSVACRNPGCHFTYCSQKCSDSAWAVHHWAECPAAGRWRDAFEVINRSVPPLTSAADEADDLPPHLLRLTLRILAMASCNRILSCQTTALEGVLPPMVFLRRLLNINRCCASSSGGFTPNVAQLDAVRDQLLPQLTPEERLFVQQSDTVRVLAQRIRQSTVLFAVSSHVSAIESIEMHRGWLRDGNVVDTHALRILDELQEAYRAAFASRQVRCAGLFRMLSCMRYYGEHDPPRNSVTELDSSALTIRSASPSTGSATECATTAPLRTPNCAVSLLTRSAQAGLGVHATIPIARSQPLILDCHVPPMISSAASSTRNSSSSAAGNMAGQLLAGNASGHHTPDPPLPPFPTPTMLRP